MATKSKTPTIGYLVRPKLSPIPNSEKWELAESWHVALRGEWFVIPEGYRTDGASIPRFLWRVCGHPFSGVRMIPALVHDALYDDLIPCDDRKVADKFYRDGLIEQGFARWKARLEYTALRWFGGSHWRGDDLALDLTDD